MASLTIRLRDGTSRSFEVDAEMVDGTVVHRLVKEKVGVATIPHRNGVASVELSEVVMAEAEHSPDLWREDFPGVAQ